MDIESLTVSQARQIAQLFGGNPQCGQSPWVIGAKYFIRTVTHHLTGRLVSVGQQELVIESAAWIADDGRFMQAVASGDFAEVEPFPDGPVIVGRGSVLDAVQINILPRSQK